MRDTPLKPIIPEVPVSPRLSRLTFAFPCQLPRSIPGLAPPSPTGMLGVVGGSILPSPYTTPYHPTTLLTIDFP